jgi:hypothetical protein
VRGSDIPYSAFSRRSASSKSWRNIAEDGCQANAARPKVRKEFFRSAPDPLSGSRYVLYWGEEYRNSFPLGHILLLNLKKLVPPFFTHQRDRKQLVL